MRVAAKPNNVTEVVVPANMCSGCGVCAGVCPNDCLEMRMHKGMYHPHLVGKCLSSCDMCLSVCPFYEHERCRDDMTEQLFGGLQSQGPDPAIGYYLQAYVGHSLMADHRERGASGGMATSLLESLLASGLVDRVLAVGDVLGQGHPFFRYCTCTDVEQVRESAASKYYPVEISAELRRVWQDRAEHRYAIVGLPCTLQGVRRAMARYPKLARRVRFLLGIVCNHCPGSYYTEYLCALTGVSSSNVHTVAYRLKGIERANDYRFAAMKGDGGWSRSIGFQGLPSRVWNKQYFAYNACSYCDDVFAEVADAVFLDAWLKEYIPDTQGTSIVIVRNAELQAQLDDGCRTGFWDLRRCPVEDVIASQKNLVYRKKETVHHRMAVRLDDGNWLPQTRLLAVGEISQVELRTARQEARVIRFSTKLWPFFRRVPARFLPMYSWMVDRIAGSHEASIRQPNMGSALRQSLRRWVAPRALGAFMCALRTMRRILQRGAWKDAALILPPSSPGSLGDEAVFTALVQQLTERGIRRVGVVLYASNDRWDSVVRDAQIIDMEEFFLYEGWRARFRFASTAFRYGRFYLLGTDVLDGYYSELKSIRRLGLADLASRVGCQTTITGFSYNEHPAPSTVDALRDLPRDVRLCARDPLSRERVARLTHRPVELVADLALLLEGDNSSEKVATVLNWISSQRSMSRVLVGFNVNNLLLRHEGVEGEDHLVHAFVAGLLEMQSRIEQLGFLLIPHDFRGQVSEPALMERILAALPSEVARYCLLAPYPYSATQAKAMCANLDIMLTGRMHLAIACLGQGIPTACISYQGKMEGLFQHFGLEGMTIDPSLALQPRALADFVIPLIEGRELIRKAIQDRLPEVLGLAIANLS